MKILFRHLLELRQHFSDQVILDYITIAHISPEPGIIATNDFRSRWVCSQSQVSRRLNALAVAGLVDLTPGHGSYRVHAIATLPL